MDGSNDLATRSMHVKVLYTFDRENKTNCLARMPNVLPVAVLSVDGGNQIGLVALSKCLHAVLTASPELFSLLSESDFTIYAHDYSEDGAPLVGQGMLSSAIAAMPHNDQDAKKVVGRVCKNVLSPFTGSAKETLEVKLRLTPVPGAKQHPTSAGMTANLHNVIPQVPFLQAWSPTHALSRSQSQTHDSQRDDNLNRNMHTSDGGFDTELEFRDGNTRLSCQTLEMARNPFDLDLDFDSTLMTQPRSAPGSRAMSPMADFTDNSRRGLSRHESFSGTSTSLVPAFYRPKSHADAQAPSNVVQHQRQASAPSPSRQIVDASRDTYYGEETQSRKRVKVTRTDWHGRSSFGSRPSDLRVSAATAASMQMHRPIPKRSATAGRELEPPPRAPTPVPGQSSLRAKQQHQHQASRSLLRQASLAQSSTNDYESLSDAALSSPEECSPSNSVAIEDSPQDIPSSPPVLPDLSLLQPSSPGLPCLPQSQIGDSGYMSDQALNSSTVVESFEQESISTHRFPKDQSSAHSESVDDLALNDRTRQNARHTPALMSEISISMEAPGDMNQLPQRMLLNVPPSRRDGYVGSRSHASKRAAKVDRAAVSAPADFTPSVLASQNSNALADARPALPLSETHPQELHPPQSSTISSVSATQSRRGSLALPSISFGHIYGPSEMNSADQSRGLSADVRQPTHKRQTLYMDSEAGSPAPSDTEGRPRGPTRSGSGAQRRRMIEQKLQKSIQNGEMPTFCSHCGAIETPTWRRLYVKFVDGKPSPLDYQEGEGETVGVEIVETNENGESTRFVIRKAMKKTKDTQLGHGFVEKVVCNPCGLWFNKSKTMRPSDKWNRKVGSRRSKKSRENDDDTMTDGIDPPSEAAFGDQLFSDGVFDDGEETRCSALGVGPFKEMDNTGSSADHGETGQQHTAEKPACNGGDNRPDESVEFPFEVNEVSSKPTRRLLFPSPRRGGELKSLNDSNKNPMTPTKTGTTFNLPFSPKAGLRPVDPETNFFEAFATFDQENVAPFAELGVDKGIEELFGNMSPPLKSPAKPISDGKASPNASNDPLKTPTPSSRKRKMLSEFANPSSAANARAHDFMTSPSSTRYFLRSTPSRLERTPLRTPIQSGERNNHEVTPWSRQLARMLDDPNLSTGLMSPSQTFDTNRLPTFTTPGRTLDECDWQALEDIMNSDFSTIGKANSGFGIE